MARRWHWICSPFRLHYLRRTRFQRHLRSKETSSWRQYVAHSPCSWPQSSSRHHSALKSAAASPKSISTRTSSFSGVVQFEPFLGNTTDAQRPRRDSALCLRQLPDGATAVQWRAASPKPSNGRSAASPRQRVVLAAVAGWSDGGSMARGESEAEQVEPVRMRLATQQFRRAFADPLGMGTARETPMVQEELE